MILSLADAGNHFTKCDIDSFLVPGLPKRLLLKCPDLNISEYQESLSATVTSNRELDSFEAKFIDEFGNDASVNSIKSCKVHFIP